MKKKSRGKTMKSKSTEIVIILDRSGSMSRIASDMCGGFDAFLADQRKLDAACTVTLVQFDDRYETVYAGRPLRDVPPLVLVPRGSTALYDAIGRTIDGVGARLAHLAPAARPDQVIFVIITDGEENASREYSHARIVEQIAHQRAKYSWEFVFLGAGENAIATATNFGIARANAAVFVASAGLHAQGVFRGVSDNLRGYRISGNTGDVQASYDAASKSSTGK
jgi:hypothetical protein